MANSWKSQAGINTGRLYSLDALRGFDMFWIIGGGELFEAISQMLSEQSVSEYCRADGTCSMGRFSFL